jgi:hypothetical protein
VVLDWRGTAERPKTVEFCNTEVLDKRDGIAGIPGRVDAGVTEGAGAEGTVDVRLRGPNGGIIVKPELNYK